MSSKTLPPGLSAERAERLRTQPRLADEHETIEEMVKIFCHAKHNTRGDELCEDCRAFLDYAIKRLACCPYGNDKPVCGKCKIHCYKPAMRETTREIMAFAGPRLMFRHPVLSIKHLIAKRIPAPDKPRNKPRETPTKKD